jgi:hypothetical protein
MTNIRLDRLRARNLVAHVVGRQLTPDQVYAHGAADADELADTLCRETEALFAAAVAAVTSQRQLAEAVHVALTARGGRTQPRPPAWSDQYAKDYESGWRVARACGGEEERAAHARRRFVSHAWHDGFEDYSSGQDKWTKRRERLEGDYEPEPPRPPDGLGAWEADQAAGEGQ